MGKTSRHPLFQAADSLKRALRLNGFEIYDDDKSLEVVQTCQTAPLFARPEALNSVPVSIAEPGHQLRTELLCALLPQMGASGAKRAVAMGRIYDRSDERNPSCIRLEGVVNEDGIDWADMQGLWSAVAGELFGLGSAVTLEATGSGSFSIMVTPPEGEAFLLGAMGKGDWLARSLYGTEGDIWLFSLDADNLALVEAGIDSRDDLYSVPAAAERAGGNTTPAYPDSFEAKAVDALRQLGYTEFVGLRFYGADAYTKMNMFQGEWDLNNKPILLEEPLGDLVGLPTVLVPALEEAMGACYRAGLPEVRLFEIAHIFLPGRNGGEPTEKLALAMGGYGGGLDAKGFKADVDQFLSASGISNHFFIPTDIPIPYRPGECNLLMDEKMAYLESNFGGACQLAEDNHGVGEHMFISQFELAPLEAKAAEEHGFVPHELR